jgi:hypothetical protein
MNLYLVEYLIQQSELQKLNNCVYVIQNKSGDSFMTE